MKRTIVRKEYHIVEVYKEIEVEEEDLYKFDIDRDAYDDMFLEQPLLCLMDEGLFESRDVEFNLPEQSQFLGYIDILDDVVVDYDIYDDKMLCDDKEPLRTFYFDYTSLEKVNSFGQYLRDKKLDSLL